MTDDCSNIEYIYFNDVSFSFDDSMLLLKQFALKFKNLKKLKFNFRNKCDSCVLLLWKLFNNNNNSNNSNIIDVELIFHRSTKTDLYNKLCQLVEQEHLKINKIEIELDEFDRNWNDKCKYINKLFDNENLKQLTFDCNLDTKTQKLSSMIYYLSKKDEISVNSIKVQNIKKLNVVTHMLTMKFVIAKQILYVYLHNIYKFYFY